MAISLFLLFSTLSLYPIVVVAAAAATTTTG
jgi:hypothetical protein